MSKVRDRVFIQADESQWKSCLKITVMSLRYLGWREFQRRLYDHCSLTIKGKKCLYRLAL